MVRTPIARDRAYAYCERLARDHYENFPVASYLLPAAMRPHIAAIYAFARRADDFADEAGLPDDERCRLLDDWLARLRAAAADEPSEPAETATGDDLIFHALGRTMRRHALPLGLFEDLLSAFRQDVTVRRYATWADLLDYCRRSANPVGRLVLRIAGCDDVQLDRASDALCTALQLANFWQDLERDWVKGRLYVPRADADAAGAMESDLDARRMTPAWRAALAAVAARTRTLFDEGRAVADGVSGRLRWELRFTWLGGVRILDRLERAGFDVFEKRPALGPSDAPAILWGALAWPPGRTTHARAKA
jgi:phytoene synthase